MEASGAFGKEVEWRDALAGYETLGAPFHLRKKRQPVTGYEVEVRAEQAEEPPMVFTRVEIKHRLRGQIDPEAVKTAIHLSETKYCSVGAMISNTARVETTFEIVPATPLLPSADALGQNLSQPRG